MALTVGTNSWVTVVESNLYLADKYGASEWVALTTPVKEQLLITAFYAIYSDPDYTISLSATAILLKSAQIETAWYLYENNDDIKKRTALQSMGVIEFQIGGFKEKYAKADRIPQIAKNMLEGFVADAGIALFERELD